MEHNLYVGGNTFSHIRRMILDLNFYCDAPSMVDFVPTLNLQIYQAAAWWYLVQGLRWFHVLEHKHQHHIKTRSFDNSQLYQ
jgi:hypothetical protein